MIVTLVALVCSLQGECLERVVTDSDESGITMASCLSAGQMWLAQWKASSPYADWRLERYRCIETQGKYVPSKGA